MRKPGTRLALTILPALALAACGGPALKPQAEPPAVSAETALVEKVASASSAPVEAVVVGRKEAFVASRLAGPIGKVYVTPGQTVAAGAPLVRLESSETEAAEGAAKAALTSARSALEIATRNRQRFESLSSRGAAAAVELDRTRLDEASAEAQVSAAQAALRRAETDRGQAILVAPFDAVVIDKMVSEGELVLPGRPLLRLASRLGRRAEAALGEDEAAHLAVGTSLDVEVLGRTVKAPIVEIVAASDPATRRRLVRVELPADVQPAVGTYARLFLPSATATEKTLAPAAALVKRGGLDVAWVVGAEGTLQLRYVQPGPMAPDGRIEVRSGLKSGDRVVLSPPADLAAGARLKG